MFSMPPATASFVKPDAISWAAETMDCAPEPHTRLTVIAGTETGRPASMADWRAGFILLPAWITLPKTTASTSKERPCPESARRRLSRMAAAPSSVAGTLFNDPLKDPRAVRTGWLKTISGRLMDVPLKRSGQKGLRRVKGAQ